MKKTAFIILLIPALLFVPAFLFNHMPFFMDIAAYFYPLRCAAARQLAQGRLPLWTSSVYAGMPLLANPQIAALYPPNWLFFALPRGGMFSALFMLHVYLMGLGIFFWLRARRFPADAALGAALLVQASGATWAHVAFGSYLFAMGLAPWLFFMQERLWRTRRAIYFSGMAAVAALLILCGAIQAAYYAFLLLFLSCIFRIFEMRFSRRALYLLLATIGAIALGAGLAAVQLLPAREFVAQTVRAGSLPMRDIKVGSLTFRRLLEAHLGCRTFPQDTGDAAYIGAAGLFIILWGALASGRRRRIGDIIFWLGFLSLGVWPLSGIYSRLLPGFGGFHDPRRILSLAPLAAAPLLARGLLALRLKKTFAMPARILFIFLAALSVSFLWSGSGDASQQLWQALGFIPNLPLGWSIALSGVLFGAFLLTTLLPAKRRMRVSLLLCLALIEILNYSLCRIDTKFAPESKFRPQTQIPSSKIPPDQPQSPVRIFSYDPSMNYSYDYFRAADSWMPNIAALEGVSDFQGYEPLRSVRYTTFLTLMNQSQRLLYAGHFGILRHVHSPLIERAGITHAIGTIPVMEPRGSASGGQGRWIPAGEQVHEYIPRPARFAYNPTPAILDSLEQTADLLNLQILVGDMREIIELPGGKPPRINPEDDPATASIRIAALAEDRAVVDVEASDAGYLIYREGWAPGWRAFIDRRPAANLHADLIFQAVRIEKGAHRIEWRYLPASLIIGIIISFISLIMAVMIPFYLRRKHEIPQNKFQR